MSFQADSKVIRWRLHLRSSPDIVFEILTTDRGRAKFWVEKSVEKEGYIEFYFPNRLYWRGKVIEKQLNKKFVVEYFGGSIVTFLLESDGKKGTDLTLNDEGVPKEDRTEIIAGWGSVLLNLKAAVDFTIDLRNHDSQRTWDQGYVDN